VNLDLAIAPSRPWFQPWRSSTSVIFLEGPAKYLFMAIGVQQHYRPASQSRRRC
jgi:hypothetical protein